MKIRLISGRMTVICHQSSPKSSLERYHKHCAILQTLLSGHPLLSGHLGRSQRCPLNRGFTVCTISYTRSMLSSVFFSDQCNRNLDENIQCTVTSFQAQWKKMLLYTY